MADVRQRTDGELLDEFAGSGNEEAFAELVARHGAMVHGVCSRVVADHQEAQDIAQAVFLALARKAKSLGRGASIGGWLHHVAACLARNARDSRASRQRREAKVMLEQTQNVSPVVDRNAFREEVDAALAALPERYRWPMVIFHMEERSLEETARQLGLNVSTVGNRLARAREMLRAKLVRRGVAIGSVGALTTLLSAEAGAAVLPASFASATAKAAGLAAAGKLAAGVTAGTVSANVAALTQGAVKMMLIAKLKLVAAGVVVCALTAGTVVAVAQQAAAPAQTHTWMTKTPEGPVDINPMWATFDRLDQTGELVFQVQPAGGQSGGPQPAPVEVRLKIADGREDTVRKAAASLAKGAKVKVGYVRDSVSRERFVWDLATM